MNKEIVNKYKKEFDHWLDGGEVLYLSRDGCWELCDNKWQWKHRKAYIINDEYVEFRKALAEGKTIEFDVGNWEAGKEKWITKAFEFEADPKFYRIKPEEHEFKVGDYVYDLKTSKSIYRINRICNSTEMFISGRYGQIHVDNSCSTTVSNLKLWTLEEADDEEWVYAWDDKNTESVIQNPTLMKALVCREDYSPFDNVVPDMEQTAKQLGLEK